MKQTAFHILVIATLTFSVSSLCTAQSTMPDNTAQFRIGISSEMNGFFDEAMLYFEAGVPGYDQYDSVKPPFGTNGAPQIASVSADGAPLAINSFGAIWQQSVIPLKVKGGVTGNHIIKFFDGPGFLEGTCIQVEDTETNDVTRVHEGDSLIVFIDANTPADPPRFNLHISTSNAYSKSDVSCFGMNDGEAAIVGGYNGPWTYDWYEPGGIFLNTQANHFGVSKLDNASAGIYRVDISGPGSCGTLTSYIEITSPPAILSNITVVDEHCSLNANGSIEVEGEGGVPPYSYNWGTGSTGSTLDGLSAGNYDLYINDSTGCSRYFPAITVGLYGQPDASIGVSSELAMVNEPIYFENGNHTGIDFLWNFGDGTTSTEHRPVHAFAEPGAYEVRLILSDLTCVDTGFATVTVGTNGITDIGPFKDVMANYDNGTIHIQGADYTLDQSSVSVIDAAGRKIIADQPLGKNRQIPLTASASGVYRLILMNPAGRKAIPITIIQ